MNASQGKLPGVVGKKASRNDDYVNLFAYGIFPTGDIDILETGGNLLIIKSYEFGKLVKMPKPHRRIFKLLTRYGAPLDAPGTVSVVCVEGLGHTPREWILFDHQGEHPVQRGTLEDWRGFLSTWFTGNRRRR